MMKEEKSNTEVMTLWFRLLLGKKVEHLLDDFKFGQ